MAIFHGKQWLRDNLTPYLKIIKTQLNVLGSVAGQYAGKGITFASLPTLDNEGEPLIAGDWSVLTENDIGTGTVTEPQYPAGTYLLNASTEWELIQASGSGHKMHKEVLTVTATNVLLDCTVAPIYEDLTTLNVNGEVIEHLSSSFSISGSTITWHEDIAEYDLVFHDFVVITYFT